MLGYVGLIALLMFAGLAWQISRGKRATSSPPQAQSPDEMNFDVVDDNESELRPEEVRIVHRREKSAFDDPEAKSRPERRGAVPVEINPEWLTGVKDNTVGIRQHEAEAYYRVLAKAKSTPLRELQAGAVRDALYVNLMSAPDDYRGKPVTMIGELRKLSEFPAPPNDYGLDRLYDAWILTADSGTNPIRVVASSLAPELKPDESIGQAVKVTGYFFKREGYETVERRLHVAPTLLAGSLSPYMSPQAPPPVEHVVPWMMGLFAAIGMAMLATVIGFAVSDRRGARWRSPRGETERLDTQAMLQVDHRLSIPESLRRLANEESLTESSEPTVQGNGDSTLAAELPDELIDLPTPFPPTRLVKRWDER